MKTISPFQLIENPFTILEKDWMLVTAGTPEHFNTMTAAWGGFGVLWKVPVVYIFIRPTRYTYEFTEKYNSFTLSFFEEKYRDILRVCGTKSGREINKMNGIGLTPVATGQGNVIFDEARLNLECNKLYFDDIKPQNFLDPLIDKNYPLKDYHRMYIGEIKTCTMKE